MELSARKEAVRSIATAKHKLDHVDFKTTHIKNMFAHAGGSQSRRPSGDAGQR